MSDDYTEGLPVLPHLAGEFYAWLWWASEDKAGFFDLGGDVGGVELWVDERLAFRRPDDNKVTAVMTGENPSTTMEARAALAGGKVLQELRLHLRRDEKDFTFTLKGPEMAVAAARLPQEVKDGDEAIYDRMFLYEQLAFVIGALFRQFCEIRAAEAWDAETLPTIRRWVLAKE